MLIESEEMKKLLAAGFDHDQAKSVLNARAMANDRVRKEVIAEMLQKNGFTPSQARVIATSACRHARSRGGRRNAAPDFPPQFMPPPEPGISRVTVGFACCGLVAIVIAVIAMSNARGRPAVAETGQSTEPAPAKPAPEAGTGLRQAAAREMGADGSERTDATHAAATPAADKLVFLHGKFVRVSTIDDSSPPPPSTEEEWRREAARQFPALPIKGTPFNTLFVAEYYRLRAGSPSFFEGPDWPIILARTCDRYLSRSKPSSVSFETSLPLFATQGSQSYRPTAGGVIFDLYPGSASLGKMRVTNRTKRHALCKLVDLKTGAKIYTLLVLANSNQALSGIPNGEYRVMYAFGDAIFTGTDCFEAPGGFAEFGENLEFTTKRAATGFVSSNHELTLEAGSGDGAHRKEIRAEEFDRY